VAMEHLAGRRVAPGQTARDTALAAGITAAGLAEVWAPLSSAMGEGSPVASSVVVVLLGVAVALRRARPAVVLAAVVSISMLAYALAPVHVQFWGGMVPIMLAVYTVARHEGRRLAWAMAGVTAVLMLILDLAMADLLDPNDFAFRWANAVVAFGLGRVLSRTEETARASALEARAAEENTERASAAARAEERARIAREMHDVVAHSVSVIVVQAGAAEAAMDEDPAYTRDALDRIRRTGAETLEDMRRLLTVLREHQTDEVASPQPGLASLRDLLEQAQAGGLRTDLVVQGQPRPLPAGLDLTAYRIVQEALTNVRRHAAADLATVRLRYGHTEMEVEVVDDGRGRLAAVPSTVGHGMVGMRERVALYGGRLEARAELGGFRVRAVLPLGDR
jgi:signal transduction histidine kinase